MMPINERTALIQPLLPEDPEPGQIFRLEKGQVVGGATVINVYKGGTLIGAAQSLTPIANVSGKYCVDRLSSSIELKERDVLHIKAIQYSFNQVIFIEYFGWIGSGVIKKHVTLADKHYRVLAVIPVGEQNNQFRLYEKVCLEVIQGEKK